MIATFSYGPCLLCKITSIHSAFKKHIYLNFFKLSIKITTMEE